MSHSQSDGILLFVSYSEASTFVFCFCFGPKSRWWRSIIYNSWWYKPSTDIVWEREKSNMLPLQNVVSNASNLVTVVAWIIRYVSAIQASDTYLLRTTVDILLSSQSISRWRSTLFFFHTFFDFFVWKWSSTSSPRNIVSQKSLCIYTLKKKQRKCVSLFTPFVWNYLENIIYITLWNDCTKPSEMIHHVPMFSSLDDLAAVLFRAIFTMQYKYKPATIEWIECWKQQRKEGKKRVMQHISSSSYIDSPPPFFFLCMTFSICTHL